MKRVYAENMPQEMEAIAASFVDGRLDDALGSAGIVIQEGLARNFSSEAGPSGQWPDRVKSLPHPMLIETGSLLAAATGTGPGSIRRVIDGRTLEVGVDKSVKLGGIPGAAAHNFGYPPGNLPQREWLYATDQVLGEAAEILAEHALTELFA